MTISIFASALSNISKPAKEFMQYLGELVPGMFDDLEKTFKIEDRKKVALYILYGYSKDSAFILLEANWDVNKDMIAEKIELPEALYPEVLELKDENVRYVIRRYLTFQGDKDFMYLKVNQDLLSRASLSLQETIGGEDFDFSGLKDRKTVLKSFHTEIEELENKLKEKHDYIYENIKQLNYIERDKDGSVALEDCYYVRTAGQKKTG